MKLSLSLPSFLLAVLSSGVTTEANQFHAGSAPKGNWLSFGENGATTELLIGEDFPENERLSQEQKTKLRAIQQRFLMDESGQQDHRKTSEYTSPSFEQTNNIVTDAGEVAYSEYSQAWRMLGFYIDCSADEDQDRRHLEDNQGSCQRYLLWAAVRCFFLLFRVRFVGISLTSIIHIIKCTFSIPFSFTVRRLGLPGRWTW